MRFALLRACGVALVSAAALAAPSKEDAQRPNILVVTIDTWRGNALSIEDRGYQTPALDGLAARGARFENVLTTAPITLTAHCSLFTGLYANHHGVRDNAFYKLRSDAVTLAEIARGQGYRTAAVIGAFVLDRRFGLDRGYDRYDDAVGGEAVQPALSTRFPERPANVVLDRALEALDAMPPSAPWHLWIHFYDAHHPYVPHAGLPAGYAGEVAFVDQEVGKLLGALERRPDGARTLVLVVGDHGEGLGENGDATHGYFLYRATSRVTAILAGPGVGHRTTATWVSLVDLMPTLLSLARLHAAPGDGRDLAPYLAPGSAEPPPVPVFEETRMPWNSFRYAPSYAVVDGARKLIASGRTIEILDPADESRTLALPDAERARLMALVTSYKGAAGAGAAQAPDPEALASIASLGYVGAPPEVSASEDDRPAASTRSKTIDAVHAAQELLSAGRADEGAKLLDGVLGTEPENARARILRAGIAIDRRDNAAAARLLAPLKDDVPTYGALYWEVTGNLALAAGQTAAARADYERAVHLDDTRSSAHASIGLILAGAGDYQGALPHLRRSAELEPRNADAAFNVGLCLARLGNEADALAALAVALRLDPSVGDRVRKTAELDASMGSLASARLLYLACLAASPGDESCRRGLAEIEKRRAVTRTP
ncbi:MAG: sulfatase-like hydrolase/transferase [Acidobacteriota bacterium]